jgi:hypothetical protein
MDKPKEFKRIIKFEETDWEILRQYAQENGLGGKWVNSATLQLIRLGNKAYQKEDCKDSRPTG